LTASFTPDAASSSAYNSASGSATVTVVTLQKTTPTVVVTPSSSSITTAQVLTVTVSVGGGSGNITPTGSVALSGGGYISAVTVLSNGSATINIPAGSLVTGLATLTVTYVPDATSSPTYNNATGSNSVTVTVPAKTTPTITWAQPAAITYGTALSTTQLNASSTVAGSFAYSPAAGTVLGAGSQMLSVTFTPTDSTDYTSATVSVTLTVNKVTPAITWTAPAAITYGTALTVTQLDASSTVTGSFAYSPALGIVLGAGSQTLSVTFTPTDSTDYTTATASVTLTVNKATPAITWAQPAAIMYGIALSTTQLNASSTVAGSFVYSPAAGTVLGAGSQTLSVIFTPTDPTDYTNPTASVALTVSKATTAVTVTPSSSSITTAQALTATVSLSGGGGNLTPSGSVTLTSGSYSSAPATLNAGGAAINIPAGSLATGADTLAVTYTGDGNFNSSAGSASVTVTTAGSPSFTVAGTAVTVAGGATTGNTSTITVTPAGGFTGSAALTAAVTAGPAGAVNPPTFSFGSTTPISISGSAAGTAILTISTTQALGCSATSSTRRDVPWYARGGAALACILLIGIPARRRRWRTMLGMLTLLAALTTGMMACGGGSGTSTCNTAFRPATTAGIYTVTITGTSGALTETGTVTLTVQ
jgi:hypothetical protein